MAAVLCSFLAALYCPAYVYDISTSNASLYPQETSHGKPSR
jgi:hypothetical protein